MSTPTESPPQFKPNVVELVSTKHSKISGVSLYPGRAEITRVFSLSLKQGVNQVKILALPTVLEHSSLRVEGHGAATIYDVIVSSAPAESKATTSEVLNTLLQEQKRVEQAIARCKAANASLEKYFHSLDPGKVGVTDLGSHMEAYERENGKIDERLLSLEKRLEELGTEIQTERERLDSLSLTVPELNLIATVVVFAEDEGEAEIALIYAVSDANWQARYDIRVDLQSKEKAVTLIYKASICQNTGEAWEDVPLTLETVTPTFGVGLPYLHACRLSIYKPEPIRVAPQFSLIAGSPAPRGRLSRSMSTTRKVTMAHASMVVSNFGGLSTTYEVPGLISVPSDGENHNVTITELELDASFAWVTIPKIDTRVHLKAQVINSSQYTLLAGEANVYVGGSFISTSALPAVSPQESFDCPLGLDPAVRVTYQPLSQKKTSSGFYNKTSTKACTQRISIVNTKPTAIDNLKIIDRIPVSEDSQITVKLISPALSLPSFGPSGDSGTNKSRASKAVDMSTKVGDGVIAQWDGATDATDLSALGKDGKLNWVCVVPPQGKIDVSLQWEESCPANVQVTSSFD